MTKTEFPVSGYPAGHSHYMDHDEVITWASPHAHSIDGCTCSPHVFPCAYCMNKMTKAAKDAGVDPALLF